MPSGSLSSSSSVTGLRSSAGAGPTANATASSTDAKCQVMVVPRFGSRHRPLDVRVQREVVRPELCPPLEREVWDAVSDAVLPPPVLFQVIQPHRQARAQHQTPK